MVFGKFSFIQVHTLNASLLLIIYAQNEFCDFYLFPSKLSKNFVTHFFNKLT